MVLFAGRITGESSERLENRLFAPPNPSGFAAIPSRSHERTPQGGSWPHPDAIFGRLGQLVLLLPGGPSWSARRAADGRAEAPQVHKGDPQSGPFPLIRGASDTAQGGQRYRLRGQRCRSRPQNPDQGREGMRRSEHLLPPVIDFGFRISDFEQLTPCEGTAQGFPGISRDFPSTDTARPPLGLGLPKELTRRRHPSPFLWAGIDDLPHFGTIADCFHLG